MGGEWLYELGGYPELIPDNLKSLVAIADNATFHKGGRIQAGLLAFGNILNRQQNPVSIP